MHVPPPQRSPVPHPFALLILGLLALSGTVAAAPSLWRVSLATPDAYARLMEGGFDLAQVRPGHEALILGEAEDLSRLRALGFAPILVDADPGRTAAERSYRELRRWPVPRATGSVQAVPAFGAGSLGGYYTRDEIKAYLDSLISTDTNAVFGKVDTLGWSYRGRPIWAVRISAAAPGSAPKVWINSLIHAREPEGMQSVLYFMSQLHSGYGTDPELTYLVQQREIWFTPLMNPDGYAVNESTYAAAHTFGLWRKNVRDNDGNGTLNSQDGVDLNRNFGYKWGFDNVGSSGTRTSDAYRGLSAFSEKETQSYRHFADSLAFNTVLNYHTYSDLYLFPYGYSNVMTADSNAFYEHAEDFARDDNYVVGSPPRVLYTANGVADDWMYGETVEKPRAWSFTAEVGNDGDGFWPPPSRILPLAQAQGRLNRGIVYMAGKFLRVQGAPIVAGDGLFHPGTFRTFSMNLKNRGRTQPSGLVTATLRSSEPGVILGDSTATYAPIPVAATAAPSDTGFTVFVMGSVAPGRVLNFQLHIEDDLGYAGQDSFQVIVGTPTVLFWDSAEAGMGNWTGAWNTTTLEKHDGARSFADSPTGWYLANANTAMQLASPLNFGALQNAYLRFWTRWDMEQDWDGGFVEVSQDTGKTWTALAGRFTDIGVGTTGAYAGGVQPAGAPVYDALRHQFLEERINLTAYCGPGKPSLLFRFRLRSDGGTQRDGWFVDGLRVVTYADQVTVGLGELPGTRFSLGPAFPNPSRGTVMLRLALPRRERVRAVVYAADGRRVQTLLDGTLEASVRELQWNGREVEGAMAPAGVYFLRVDAGDARAVRKLVRLP